MESHFERGNGPTGYTVDLEDLSYESISEAVVRVVAQYMGTEPADLDPLANDLDPDALNSLFESASSEQPAGVKEITFGYHGFEITVSTREIQLSPQGPGN